MIDWRVFGQVSKAGQLHGLEDGYVLYFLSNGHDGLWLAGLTVAVSLEVQIYRGISWSRQCPTQTIQLKLGDRHAPAAERLNQPWH